jgi:hypothetical protein
MLKASQAHLADCGESYVAHLSAALRISWTLAGAALACAVHAFVPGMFTRTASARVEQVREGILARRAGVEAPASEPGSEISDQAL